MLAATGRHPRTAALNLASVGVETTPVSGGHGGFVKVSVYHYYFMCV